MNLFSMFTRSVTSLGNAVDHGAAMAASRLAKSSATKNAFGLGTIGMLSSRPGSRAAWGAIGMGLRARKYAPVMGAPLAIAAGSMALGAAIAPSGHRKWGVLGGPIGGLTARMMNRRR